MKNNQLLRLNLQHFAEKDGTAKDKDGETNETDASLNTQEQDSKQEGGENARIPYERFKQKVDEVNALKEKLATIEREQEDARRKELEEQNEYKTLYEQALQDAEDAKRQALQLRKEVALSKAGYGADKASLLVKLVDGETDEEIAESIKTIQATIPVEEKQDYADPSLFNGKRARPKTTDAEDLGRQAAARVLGKLNL